MVGPVLVLIAMGLGVWLMGRSDRYAARRRAKRFCDRQPFSTVEWMVSVPEVPVQAIESILPLLGRALEIAPQFLRPNDDFDRELAIADRFWCLVIDDDSRDLICDTIEDVTGTRPTGRWQKLRDVLLEVGPLWERSASFARTAG